MYVTTLENKTKTAAFTPYQPEGGKKNLSQSESQT